MDRFVSSYRNRVDAKGRVSIPAPFRAILARSGFEDVYLYPALGQACLDGGGQSLIEEIYRLIDALPAYSDERDQLSVALLGDCVALRIDGDGRILLPQQLIDHAALEGEAVIVGVGHKFQMWAPGRFDAHLAEARQKARELKKLLGRPAGEGERA
ncbi:MAG: division/cell wall cluster transcriptional repressor MraZ [Flavobacteriaceae bacterium]